MKLKILGAILMAGAALATPAAAHAADLEAAIAQPDPTHQFLLSLSAEQFNGGLKVTSRKYVIGKLSEQWKERSLGGGNFRYESMRYPGQCLQVNSTVSGEQAVLGPCVIGFSKQTWFRGFSTASLRPFRNQLSNKALTGPPFAGPIVTQQFDSGAANQLWEIVPF